MRSFREHIIYSWNGLWYLQSVATDDIIIISKHPFISPRLFDNAFGQSIESAFQPSMRWLDFFFFIFISQYSDACGYVRGEYFYFFISLCLIRSGRIFLFYFIFISLHACAWTGMGACRCVCVQVFAFIHICKQASMQFMYMFLHAYSLIIF